MTQTTQGHQPSFSEHRRSHWDQVSQDMKRFHSIPARHYRDHLVKVYRSLIPQGASVLELGCGHGDLLAALKPARGVGVDFSPHMTETAAARHPRLTFLTLDAHQLDFAEPFDFVILSDLVNDLHDVQGTLEQVRKCCTQRTRVIFNFHSQLWAGPLSLAQCLEWAKPELPQNWLTVPDLANLLNLAGFEAFRTWDEYLFPLPVPLLAPLANRYLAKLAPFRWLDLTHFMVARPAPIHTEEQKTVSVVVAARNEAGNIANIFRRVPQMGAGTELIFVEGGSNDDTYETIQRTMAEFPKVKASLYRQPGRGKGDAVRCGFAAAKGDVLMILDADLTVPPEDLPRFYEALIQGKGEFINGVRLVYPMQKQAMRFANLVGNKFFSLMFSWLLEQPIKDTLCGTKVLLREDYERIAAYRSFFGDFDPFGDFDLLFGAVKQNMRIVDLPIRYQERTYGDTNIQRWRHGLILLRMTLFAARRIKFF